MIDVDIGLSRGDFTLAVAFSAGGGATALFGRSGAGKSTVLAAVAGLVRPDRGHIRIGGVSLFDSASGIDVATHRRRIGFVFQDSRLFPHLSVRANLTYGRFFAPKGGRRLDFDDVVAVLGIEPLLDRKPSSLSGGERQRVAIGRALLAAPRILLMDEPLASLDEPRKREILALIERVRDHFGLPILYVSHSVEEVVRLATHVVVIENGRAIRAGAPAAVLAAHDEAPSTERLTGVSILSGVIAARDPAYAVTTLDHPAGRIMLPGLHGKVGEATRIIIRGADVAIARAMPAGLSIRTSLIATIAGITTDEGPVGRVDLALAGGERLSAFVTRKAIDDLDLAPGLTVHALVKSAAIADQGA